MIGLYVEVLKLVGWGIVLFYLLKYKKSLPINIYYIMLISTFLMLHSGVYDIAFETYTQKNFVWLFADTAAMAVYIMWIRKYRKYQKLIKEDIDKFISSIHDK